MYFRSYGLAKRGLGQDLKSAVSQYPSTSNMLPALNNISNHHGGTFFIVIYHP